MDAAAVAASVAAEAAKEAALAASVAAVDAAKDAAVAAATAKEEAVAASAAALKAEEAAATASAAALNAKEAADVAVTAGQAAAAAASAAAAAIQASNKRKFAAVALNAVETAPPVAATAGEVAATAAAASAAAMQASNKRKFAAVALNAVESAPPVAATAGEAAAATALQAYQKGKLHIIDVEQNPQGSGDVDDAASVDLISNLPDAVLCSIVSLLPTKEAARTQVISRRWSPLWRATPLNLVAEHKVSSKDPAFVDLISKILSVHPGPTRRFSLRLSVGDCHGKIKEWLSSQALDKLQEFELIAGRVRGRGRGRLCHIPSSMYRFTPTLRVAKFCGCHFSKLIAKLWLQFPCLKQLTLDRVSITEDALQGMLSGCSALESLELKDNFGFACLCISSKTLKSIVFCTGWSGGSVHLKELVIKDTPCLERFLQLRPVCVLAAIRVISAPKLKILGMLSEHIAELQFGTSVFQKMIAARLTTKMHTVRVLFLVSAGPNLDEVLNFLKCFPCLERLYVLFKPLQLYPFPTQRTVMDNVQKYDLLGPIECLELHLRKVELKNYDGTKSSSIDFAKFFVLNAKVLKEMKITLPYHRQNDWFANQSELLQIKDRASEDARIELKCGTDASLPHSWHTHDLSMDDPFDMPSSGCSMCS